MSDPAVIFREKDLTIVMAGDNKKETDEPVWAPDSKRIVSTSDKEEPSWILVVSGGRLERLSVPEFKQNVLPQVLQRYRRRLPNLVL